MDAAPKAKRSARTLREVVARQLETLAAAAALAPARRKDLDEVFALLTAGALDRAAAPPFEGLSRINADGLPFQWSVSIGGPPGVRFLSEAGTPGTSARARLAFSRARLGDACEVLGFAPPRWFDDVLLRRLVPAESDWPAHWRSALWFGAGASAAGVGLKPYVNLNRDAPVDRWRRVGWVLKDLGWDGALARWCDLSARVSADSWPVGAAVDLAPGEGPARLKIYFRSGAVDGAWLARWYEAVGPGEARAVRALLDAFPFGGARWPDRAFVVSLEFHRGTDAPTLKTDLAATRWIAGEAALVAGVRRLLADVELDERPYLATLDALGARPADARAARIHRFVGLGFEPDGARHVNVYLAPPLDEVGKSARARGPRPASRARDGAAVASGLRFLADARVDDHWEDFSLPVGVASAWVTAWVLVHTARLEDSDGAREFERIRLGALAWLTRARTPGGGWGYRPGIDDDADSTALAIRALALAGERVPIEAEAVLGRCARSDGGIATYPADYPPGGAWVESAPDVTPLAAAALAAWGDAAAGTRARAYLAALRRENGTWPAYWWRTPLYTTWTALAAFGADAWTEGPAALRATLAGWRPVGAFETALLALSADAIGAPDIQARAIAILRGTQLPDGSWPSDPILRLTPPEVARPWVAIDAGALYEDRARAFTTAVAVAALGATARDVASPAIAR